VIDLAAGAPVAGDWANSASGATGGAGGGHSALGVNQTGTIMGGRLDAATLARLAANYAIPYLVSSIGFLSAHRTPSRRPR
jgi:hypothetical protein